MQNLLALRTAWLGDKLIIGISVADPDPGSGAFYPPDPGSEIRDAFIPDPGSDFFLYKGF
jgi:hypothetical protein